MNLIEGYAVLLIGKCILIQRFSDWLIISTPLTPRTDIKFWNTQAGIIQG